MQAAQVQHIQSEIVMLANRIIRDTERAAEAR